MEQKIYKCEKFEYPDQEHGHYYVEPIKKHLKFDSDFNYRSKGKINAIKKFFVEFLLQFIARFLSFVTYGQKYYNRNVFARNKDLLKNGYITISNHCFLWDNIIIRNSQFYKRMEMPLWYEGATGIHGTMYRLAGGIPVPLTIGGKLASYEAQNEVLKEHKWLHVYPEAACWPYYVPIREFFQGAFRLAYENNVPIIPIGFSYRESHFIRKWLRKGCPSINVNLGEPIMPNLSLPKKESVAELQKEVHLKIVQLCGIKNEEENEEIKKQYKYFKYTQPEFYKDFIS